MGQRVEKDIWSAWEWPLRFPVQLIEPGLVPARETVHSRDDLRSLEPPGDFARPQLDEDPFATVLDTVDLAHREEDA